MNFWILLFVIAASQGYFVALILLAKKENRIPNRLLGLFILLLAITLTEWLLWWTELIRQVPGMIALGVGLPLLYGPLLFLFYQVSFQSISRRWWVHLLPFGLLILLILPFYLRFFYKIPPLIEFATATLRHPVFPILMFSQMSFYGIWIAVRFRSFLKGKTTLLRWHRIILVAYWGILLAYVFYRLMPSLELKATEWKYLIALSITIFIYLIAWLGYVQPQVLLGLGLIEALSPKKYRKSSLTPEESKALYVQITKLMEVEALYTNSELGMDELSRQLNKTRHHVSQAINEHASRNFADFVNGYRIKAAQERLVSSSKKEKNVIEIAYEVGFNTKKAFNLAFKKRTGMTPSEYRQAHQKNG